MEEKNITNQTNEVKQTKPAPQAQKAKAENKVMVAMEHYPVLPGQPALMLIPDARQKESKKLIETLADNGVHLIFTGHMHNQSINVTQTEKGNKFYDVCTGSLIGCPAYYRLVTVKDEKTVEIESRPIPSFEWDTKGKTSEEYLKIQFERMIRTVLYSMEKDPRRFLGKFGSGDKENLYKPVSYIGKKVNIFFTALLIARRLVLFKNDEANINPNDTPITASKERIQTFSNILRNITSP